MRIVDIRECAIPLNSNIRNSSIDFSEMTTSVVAVITDVMRDGAPASCCASSQSICSMAPIPAVRQKRSKELSTSCQAVGLKA